MVDDPYPSQRVIWNIKEGREQESPQTPTTRFRMKNGAQQMTKVEKTTPRTLLAFSSDTVLVDGCGGLGAKGRAPNIDFPLQIDFIQNNHEKET